MTTVAAVTRPDAGIAWALPDRGRVGMYGLIAAEAAIFTIFVVAYLFYVGKSATGPQPNQVLHTPVLLTICLLSSSVTIHAAVTALRAARTGAFLSWLALTVAWIVTLLERRQIVSRTGVRRTWFGCGPVALLPT